jgi:hypothetical protein
VEVFRHSALVHRKGAIRPQASGDNERFELAGLPLGVVDSSVRAAVEPHDGAGARVVDLQISLDVQTPIEQTRIKELERFKELRRQLERLHREQRRLEERSASLGNLSPLLPPSPKRPDRERFATDDPLSAWLALGDFVRQSNDARLERARELTGEIRKLEDELKLARDELEQLSSEKLAGLRVGKRVLLRLAAPLAASCQVAISYQVPGARWFPSYELRVDQSGERAELVMGALVAQVTGEDWHEVSVALSTADLNRRCDLPRLGAWRIGRARADRHRAWRELPEDLPQLFADFDRERPPEPARSAPPTSARGEVSISDMIAETLTKTQKLERRPAISGGFAMPEPHPPEPEGEDDEDSFSPHEITRENMEEAAELAEDIDQLFEDEPTPQDAPMPQAPPPPLEAMAPQRGGGAPPAGPPLAAGPASASIMAAPVKKKARKRDDRSRRQSLVAPAATSVVPSDELLSFGSLVLPSAHESRRGILRPIRFEEQLSEEEREGDTLQVVRRTEERWAGRVLELKNLAPPRGVRDVGESAGHFAYRYPTRVPMSLPADGTLHRLGVLREERGIDLVFRTVPQTDSAVYRVAKMKNPLSAPLLAGPLDVFWGNDFLVTARLRTTASGAEIEANLGVEPRIKTARNVRHSQHEEGLLAGRTVYEDTITIEVENGLAQQATVEVLERLPVTEERKVEVKLLEEKPAAEEYTQKERRRPIRGGRRWRLTLEPGKRGECQLRYSVTVPSSSEIIGGGRRA